MTEELPNSRDILSIVSVEFRQRIEAIPPEYFTITEKQLTAIAYPGEAHPPELDSAVRISFWKEYYRSQKTSTRITMANIYQGVCHTQAWQQMVTDPARLAYILTEPTLDDIKKKSLLLVGWSEMYKILTMDVPINAKTGTPEAKYYDLKIKVFEFLYTAIHGSPTQRIQQETKNLNYNVDATQAQRQMTPAEIDAKIKELEAKDVVMISNQEVLLPVEKVHAESGRVSEEYKR